MGMAVWNMKKISPIFVESDDHAILRMKFASQIVGMEIIPFEELINREDCFIRIDFPDGHSFMEHEFKKVNLPEEKYFVEFFDTYHRSNLMDYFSKETSNYRVTDSDGTVIRMAHIDNRSIQEEKKKQKKKTTHHVLDNELHAFYGDIQLIQNTLLKIIQKKDK